MKDIYAQAALVTLNDQELLDLVGFCYEEGKRVEERMKSDPTLLRLQEEMKEYKQEHYLDVIKAYRSKLKAARKLAEARGLHFNLPKAGDSDED